MSSSSHQHHIQHLSLTQDHRPSHPPHVDIIPETPATPHVDIIPATASTHGSFHLPKSRESIDSDDSHLHPPASVAISRDFARPATLQASRPQTPAMGRGGIEGKGQSQERTLAALSIGAPLISSVVVSVLSVVQNDLASAFGGDPHDRPVRAQAAFVLIWSAVITSLGSTMIAVAGLALAAGYHDSHVGITKRIARKIRQWKNEHHQHRHGHMDSIDQQQRQYLHVGMNDIVRGQGGRASNIDGLRPSDIGAMRETKAAASAPSIITDTHKNQHHNAALRAAEASARLLGVSIVLLSAGLMIYLVVVYPIGVWITLLFVGLITAAVACIPLFPVVFPD